MTLDQVFPALRQLNMKRSLLSKGSDFAGEFLHLERFSIKRDLDPQIENLISKSPKLKSLSVVECPYELLSFVNKNVPQLEELELWGTTFHNISYLYDVVYRFENVKKMFIKTNCNPPRHFTFDRLDELQIDGSYHFELEWLNFTVQNTNLKKFEFEWGWLDAHKSETIADKLKNLEEATITCDSSVQSHHISQFVINNQKLKRLRVKIDKTKSATVQASLRNGWMESY